MVKANIQNNEEAQEAGSLYIFLLKYIQFTKSIKKQIKEMFGVSFIK